MQSSAWNGQQQRLNFSSQLSGFARLLDQRGKTGPERLAAFERLPGPVQELAWRSLRRNIEQAER